MNPTCHSQREVLVEYVLGELDGLKAARLEAHLDNCESCARAHARLVEGLGAARSFEPKVADEELERRSRRLAPFLAVDERPARFGGFGRFTWVVAGAAACAVGVAMLVGLPPSALRPGAEVAQVVEDLPAVAPSAPVAAFAPGPVQHQQLTPHLKAVTSPEWQGRVSHPEPGVTQVDMDAGFAVLDFEGGQQRILRVQAPQVHVRVLGTRFFVEARSGIPTAVGVITGRVEVRSKDQVEVLGAGQVRAYDASGAYTPDRANLRSQAHHEDVYLARVAPEVEPPAPPTPASARKPAEAKAPDHVGALTRAEGLVRAGRVAEGLEVYQALLDAQPPAEIRDLARYEQARVWGFERRDYARAERALRALAQHAQGEVKTQAALALCEVALAQDPCQAQRCLLELGAQADLPLGAQAQALLRTWGVSGLTCGDHKNPPPAQPTK